MAANTADTLNNIESALGTISSSLGGFIGSKNYEDGIKKIESILANNFRKTSAKNTTSTGSTNGGRTLGNTVGEMLGVLKNIDKHFIGNGSVNQGIKDVNKNVKDAVRLLEQIEQHIGNTPSNSTTSNANSTTEISNIDKNVVGIYNELKKIRVDLTKNSLNTGNDELDKRLLEIADLQSKRNLKREKFNDLREKARSGKKEDVIAYQKALKEKRKGDKRLKRIEEGNYGVIGVTAEITRGITNFIKEKPDASKAIDKGVGVASTALSSAGPWGALAGSILQAAKALFDLGAKQDKATTEFARAVGGFKQGKITAGRSVGSMIETADRRRGYTAEAAYSAMTEIAEARGRTTERLSPEALKSAIDLRRFGISADVINNFDTFGKSIEDTDKYFAKLYSEVSKKGLSFKNVSKAVNDNLKAAQSHTFANGLRGLEAMAERSVQLKYNMQQVFQFADKVSEIEGAIGTAANLSVLGGSFAQFSNPMQMLYEGLNDMEALQKRIESTFGGKAYWNQEKGQIDMTALDREFVKQAAKSMGVDPNEMLSMSYNQARRERVGKQIGKGIGNDTSEYIKNIAELDKNGRAFVNLNGKNIAVSDLNETHKEQLQRESERKGKAENTKLGDIYQNTMSITDKMDNLLTYLQEKLGFYVYKIYTKWFLGGEKDYSIEARGTGNIEIKNKREELFSRYEGKNPENYAKRLAGMSASEVETAYSRLQVPKAANGINPYFVKPGDGGILGGRSHLKGGNLGKYGNTQWEAEAGEYLINKNSSSVYKNELNKIQNGTFNPYSYANQLIKNDMAKYFSPMKVAEVQKPIMQNETNVVNSGLNGRIKIDIPETITINLAGGEKIGNYDIREIVMAYVDKFMKEATMRKNFSGFNKEEFYNKSDVI